MEADLNRTGVSRAEISVWIVILGLFILAGCHFTGGISNAHHLPARIAIGLNLFGPFMAAFLMYRRRSPKLHLSECVYAAAPFLWAPVFIADMSVNGSIGAWTYVGYVYCLLLITSTAVTGCMTILFIRILHLPKPLTEVASASALIATLVLVLTDLLCFHVPV